MEINNGGMFSYTSSSTSSPPPAAAINSSSYLSLNMMNNDEYSHVNNYSKQQQQQQQQVVGLMEKDGIQMYESSDDMVADQPTSSRLTDDLNMASGKSSIRKGEKKIRKPKHAFQTRSQVDILDDGYRWRKYGQKAVKNNKFPRNYYRCTYQGCNVKKQVQRLSNDDGVVVTTYEGMHSHPIEKSTDNFEHILTQMQIYSR
ncbi:probable WRKY transcription factor 75 [Cynara cardunculus var. scolymus]|nr:probable WRKY transcription factor 75 [Cynara cardunculus var. scolymus]